MISLAFIIFHVYNFVIIGETNWDTLHRSNKRLIWSQSLISQSLCLPSQHNKLNVSTEITFILDSRSLTNCGPLLVNLDVFFVAFVQIHLKWASCLAYLHIPKSLKLLGKNQRILCAFTTTSPLLMGSFAVPFRCIWDISLDCRTMLKRLSLQQSKLLLFSCHLSAQSTKRYSFPSPLSSSSLIAVTSLPPEA